MAATQKMVNYARAIAEKLEIAEPDFSDFGETSRFINEHSDQFKKATHTGKTIQALEKLYGKFESNFTNEFAQKLKELQDICGVYIFWVENEAVYIGKSVNLQDRVFSSLKERVRSAPITHVSIIPLKKIADTHILEIVLITEYKPDLNSDCTCEDYSDLFKSNIDLYSLPKVRIFVD